MMISRSRWPWHLTALSWVAVASTVGCAAPLAQPGGKLGGGTWQVHLPETYSPIAALAPAGDAVATSFTDWGPAATVAAARPPARARKPTRVIAPREPSWETPTQLEATPVQLTEPEPPLNIAVAPSDVHERYGAREVRAQQQQAFRGGAVVIVGSLALIIVSVAAVTGLLLMLFRDCWW